MSGESEEVPDEAPLAVFRIEFTVARGEADEVVALRGAAIALDHLVADEALAAAEYLVTRYRRLAGWPSAGTKEP